MAIEAVESYEGHTDLLVNYRFSSELTPKMAKKKGNRVLQLPFFMISL